MFPKRYQKGEKKYNNSKTIVNGITFISKFEAWIYGCLLQLWAEIIELQPRYLLQDKYKTKDGRNIRKIEFVSDFVVSLFGKKYIIEAKGQETEAFKIKRKWFEFLYPDETLVIVKSQKQLREFYLTLKK